MRFLEPDPGGGPEPVAIGSLDPPPAGPMLQREPVTLHGWVSFPGGPAVRVELWLGAEALGPARLAVPRPDVRRRRELSAGEAPGFELTVNLARWPGADGEAELRALATGPGGERLELEPLPLKVAPVPPAFTMPPPPEQTPEPGGDGLRTLVVTHQLDLGGAQLYLMDLLRELLRRGAVAPTVLSARDGSLRDELEALGVPVHISGVSPPEGLAAHLGRIEELSAWASGRGFEVAFVNTATSTVLPAVEAAARLRLPTVWAIHESYEPAQLWGEIDPAVRARAESALAEVDRAVFVAAGTQRLYESVLGPGGGLTIPYGLDLEPIDRRRRAFDRAAARAEAGIPPQAEVVLCVGSIEPRKAQILLVQAFARLAAAHPSAHLVLVGGRDDAYSEAVAELAGSLGVAERIEIVPLTPDVQPWFGLADLVACPSDLESMPRTVLEAMAWETPVLATDVFGLVDLIAEGETGWLCGPRDLDELTAGLRRALASTAEQRRRIGRAGRRAIEQRHSLAEYGAKIDALLGELAGRPVRAWSQLT